MQGCSWGCGGGGGGTPLTETEFCKQKAEAECVVTDRCVTTKTDCEADRRAVARNSSVRRRLIETPLRRGQRRQLREQGEVGLQQDLADHPTELADLDDVCNYVFQGKGKVNEDICDTQYDCAIG